MGGEKNLYRLSLSKLSRSNQNTFFLIVRLRFFSGVRRFAGVDPVAVDVDCFREVVYDRLEAFCAYSARYGARVALSVQFDFARLFVVAEGAVELGVQRACEFFLRRRLSLCFSFAHC